MMSPVVHKMAGYSEELLRKMFVPKAPKLIDCQTHGDESELFVVEGDSAARALERIRIPARQAVLPMQGKPMNAMKSSLGDVFKNLQFAALISALGLEATDQPDLDSVRYERIILLFDPDADGIHSRTLMLLFFYRWLTPMLEAGRVFDAYPPLWGISSPDLKKPAFAFTRSHLDRIKSKLASEQIDNYETVRFRGLSSVGAETLYELCVDPATRRLDRLSAEDAERALEFFEEIRPE